MPSYKPPADVARAARRALEIRRKLPTSRRGGTAVGVRRAVQLARRDGLSGDSAAHGLIFCAPWKIAGICRGQTRQIQAKLRRRGACGAKCWQALECSDITGTGHVTPASPDCAPPYLAQSGHFFLCLLFF